MKLLFNNYQITKSRVVVFLLIAMSVTGIVFLTYFFIILKSVKILPENGITITLSSQNDEIIIQTGQPKTIKVSAGDYFVNYAASEDYQAINETKTINGSTTITSPQLAYTEVKLAALLDEEKASLQTMLATIDNIGPYSISSESLFALGEWYGALLAPSVWYDTSIETEYGYPPNPNNTLDIVRLIANKKDGKWQIIAGPSVIFYLKDYPDVPEEVVRAVNALGFE